MRWSSPIILAASLAVALPAGVAVGDRSTPDSIVDSVVKVLVVANPPDFTAPWQRMGPVEAIGSGVLVSGGHVLTNAHVVADAALIEVQRGGIGRRYPAQLEYLCDQCDLALLSVADPRFHEGARALEIGGLPLPQQPVRAYGFPIGGSAMSVTEGVVSRVGFDLYSHASTYMLLAQVDAAINPGNSGGPVVTAGKLAGISTQFLEDAENIGDIVPAPVVSHFLKDVADGRFDGFPELGLDVQNLENPALRAQLGLTPDSGGVLVTAVSRSGSASGVLEPGDVLLAVHGVAIRENDTVLLESGVEIDAAILGHDAQVGDEIPVTLLREGRKQERLVTMRAPSRTVASGGFNEDPSYRIFAGLVFQPLTLRYLELYEVPPDHLSIYWSHPTRVGYDTMAQARKASNRREVVVLTGILANELTRGYEVFEDQVVATVNDQPIEDLAHLSRILDQTSDEFIRLGMESGHVIVLRTQEARDASPQVLERYRIARDRSGDLVTAGGKGE